MARVLLVHSRPARFVEIDRDLLAEEHDVAVYAQPGPVPRPLELLRAIRAADLVVCWFASWHAPPALVLARLLGRPSLLIVGGFDTASMPEIGYGYQQGGIRRLVARTAMQLATSLMTNSHYSREELRRNAGFDAEVVHHGVPDPFGAFPEGPREPVALTVSNVARIALERKGLRPFAEAGAHAPEFRFVLVGRHLDDAADELRAGAAENVDLAGRLDDEALNGLYARASAYVQASQHEGFGMALAEAMLAGCIPVATRAGALPEVVGDAPSVWLDDAEPETIADGVRRAAALGDDERRRARDRIVSAFPLEVRREGLRRVTEPLLRAGRGRRA